MERIVLGCAESCRCPTHLPLALYLSLYFFLALSLFLRMPLSHLMSHSLSLYVSRTLSSSSLSLCFQRVHIFLHLFSPHSLHNALFIS